MSATKYDVEFKVKANHYGAKAGVLLQNPLMFGGIYEKGQYRYDMTSPRSESYGSYDMTKIGWFVGLHSRVDNFRLWYANYSKVTQSYGGDKEDDTGKATGFGLTLTHFKPITLSAEYRTTKISSTGFNGYKISGGTNEIDMKEVIVFISFAWEKYWSFQ